MPTYAPCWGAVWCVALLWMLPSLTFSVYQLHFAKLLLSAFDNQVIGALAVTRLRTKRRESPRRLRMITLYAAFTTTVRVIHRIHSHTTVGRTLPEPARLSSFTEGDVLVVEVADLSDGRHAIQAKLSDFAAG